MSAEQQFADAVRAHQWRSGSTPPGPEPIAKGVGRLQGLVRRAKAVATSRPAPVETPRTVVLTARELEAAGVPERYHAADLERMEPVNKDHDSARRALLDRVESPGIVALVGAMGTGKTWMACGLVRKYLLAGRSARYARALDVFLAIRATYGQGATQSQLAVEATYRRPALLVLDEIDVRSDTPWEDTILTSVIDARYAAMKTTIIISNRDPKALSDRLGPRIVDRIREDGGVVVCKWGSFRAKTGGR